MKVISAQWGEYLDYCKKNNMMPTEEGLIKWMTKKVKYEK